MRAFLILMSCMVLAGCGTSYCWRTSVPKHMRTVAVPVFQNETDVGELGAIASRQVLREFIREGTFTIRTTGDAAIEVQGTIKGLGGRSLGYDRRTYSINSAHEISARAVVSVIDKRTHKILINNKNYTAVTTFTALQDYTTSRKDASGRLMDELSRQIVDDVLNIKW